MNDKNNEVDYLLIDASVTAYSPKEEILAWIDTLKTYPDRPEVRAELKHAYEMLESHNVHM